MTALRSSVVLLLVITVAQVGSGAAPPGRYVVATNTVLDTVTGLTWQRSLPSFTFSWTDAQAYCAALAVAGGGWRLPTRAELASLRDVRQNPGPSIDPDAFPGTPSEQFWSTTAHAGDGGTAWYVSFANGYSYSGDTGTGRRVRCVR